MKKIRNAIYEIHQMDAMAARDQWVNQLHPLVLFALTVVYIGVVVSFSKYDLIGLAGMMVYPLVLFQIAELSFFKALYRLRMVLPLVCVIGIFNPFLDSNVLQIGDTQIPAGVISMLTLMLKGIFTVFASYLLVATTSIEKICYALRCLHVPKILVTQFMLMYRYITLLLEEANRITQAYALRAPNQKGIHFKVWGSLIGQLLLRSMDRSQAVYESMVLRGYTGEFAYLHQKISWRKKDVAFLGIWLGIFLLFRKVPVIWMLGNWIGGCLG